MRTSPRAEPSARSVDPNAVLPPRALSLPSMLGAAQLSLSIASCGAPAAPDTPPEPACQSEAPGPAAKPISVGASRLGLQLSLPESAVRRELEARVPKTLATGKNEAIGAAGRVSYVIQRGGFTLQQDDGGYAVSTRLTGDIQVCKPLGSFCLNYGACRPEWAVRVSLPFDHEAPLSLSPSTVVEITKGCVLSPVGYDATPELERITRQQAKRVNGQIRHEAKRLEQRLAALLHGLEQPIEGELTPGAGSLGLELDELVLTRPTLHDERLEAKFELRGRLTSVSPAAGAPGPIGASVDAEGREGAPRVRVDPELAPSIWLELGSPWPLTELESALSEQLKQPVRVAARARTAPAARDPAVTESNELFVGLGDPACLRWHPVALQATSDRLRFAEHSAEAPLPPALAGLELTVPETVTRLGAAAEGLPKRVERELAEQLPELGVSLDSELRRRALVGQDALLLVHVLEGRAELHGEAAAR